MIRGTEERTEVYLLVVPHADMASIRADKLAPFGMLRAIFTVSFESILIVFRGDRIPALIPARSA